MSTILDFIGRCRIVDRLILASQLFECNTDFINNVKYLLKLQQSNSLDFQLRRSPTHSAKITSIINPASKLLTKAYYLNTVSNLVTSV